jgi:hypothetical protein
MDVPRREHPKELKYTMFTRITRDGKTLGLATLALFAACALAYALYAVTVSAVNDAKAAGRGIYAAWECNQAIDGVRVPPGKTPSHIGAVAECARQVLTGDTCNAQGARALGGNPSTEAARRISDTTALCAVAVSAVTKFNNSAWPTG